MIINRQRNVVREKATIVEIDGDETEDECETKSVEGDEVQVVVPADSDPVNEKTPAGSCVPQKPTPTSPLQLPCRVFVDRCVPVESPVPVNAMDIVTYMPDCPDPEIQAILKCNRPGTRLERVYGTFLFTDDVTGKNGWWYYKNKRMSSAFLFEFPDKDVPGKTVIIARPTTLETYIRGNATGKGWPNIYVHVPQEGSEEASSKKYSLIDFIKPEKAMGFKNGSAISEEMRDDWCIRARERYNRTARVSVIRENREKKTGQKNKKKQKKKEESREEDTSTTVVPKKQKKPAKPKVQPKQKDCVSIERVACLFSDFISRYLDSAWFTSNDRSDTRTPEEVRKNVHEEEVLDFIRRMRELEDEPETTSPTK